MRSITRLFSAFGTLAASLEGLAALVDTCSGKLRQSLALEGAEPAKLALPAPAVEEEAGLGELPPASELFSSSSPSASRRKAKAS